MEYMKICADIEGIHEMRKHKKDETITLLMARIEN